MICVIEERDFGNKEIYEPRGFSTTVEPNVTVLKDLCKHKNTDSLVTHKPTSTQFHSQFTEIQTSDDCRHYMYRTIERLQECCSSDVSKEQVLTASFKRHIQTC